MAKLSLSWAINRRKKIQAVTGLAVLVLLFFGISMMVSKNPKGTKAAPVDIGGIDSLIVDNNLCAAHVIAGGNWDCNTGSVPWHIDPAFDVNFVPIGHGTATTSPTTFVMRGTNHFNSLTIENNVTVTHEALIVADMATDTNSNGSIIDECAGTPGAAGCNKQVDLEIAGNLTVSSGGSINVNGKGYLGGVFPVGAMGSGKWANPPGLQNAFGPGNGGRSILGIGDGGSKSGGGGSFAGRGGPPQEVLDDRHPIYNYLTTANKIEFGSGGQATWAEGSGGDWAGSIGGTGGGRVIISCRNLIMDLNSYISANGTDGQMDGSSYTMTGGGGSGGAIVVSAVNLDMNALSGDPNPDSYPRKFLATAEGGVSVEPTRTGGIGKIVNDGAFTSVVYQLSAQGGRPDHDGEGNQWGAGGGGGWIVLKRLIQPGIIIKKSLEPIRRYPAPDVECNIAVPGSNRNCFNPYAVQKNDQIRVKLEVSNLISGNVRMEDQMLKVPGNATAMCEYVANSVNPKTAVIQDPAVGNQYKLIWDYDVPPGTTSQTFTYTCTVN